MAKDKGLLSDLQIRQLDLGCRPDREVPRQWFDVHAIGKRRGRLDTSIPAACAAARADIGCRWSHRPEVERFTTITGLEPVNVKMPGDLDAYICQCKRHYWGTSEAIRFLHWLIDKDRLRCNGGK
jgi:hypothetical protein